MRALHLNYHEITEDPRVLKECKALTERGVDVTVICALDQGQLEREQLGSLNIHRIPWMSIEFLTPEYLDELYQFRRSEQLAKAYLEKLLPNAILFQKFKQVLEKDNLEKLNPEQRYRQFSGIKRLFEKLRYKRDFRALLDEVCHDKSVSTIERKLLEATLKMVLNEGMSTPVASHQDVYQSSAFLFDLNTKHLALEGTFDVVHAHDIYTLVAGVRLARKFGAKLIYDAHEYEPERASKMPPEGNGLADAIELDCLENVDAVVTVSAGICELYGKRFTKREPVLIMNAPVITASMPDDATLMEQKLAFRERLGLAPDTQLLAYTGWVLSEQRGLAQVAKALRMLPDMHLVILGPRQARHDEALMKIAQKEGVADRIHMLPPVAHFDVVPTIRACEISIIPFQDATLSYRFAMPNKLFEGVFSGLPVAVADLPDMKHFVESLGRGLAMDSTNPQSIAETIMKLHDQSDAYQLSRENFDDLVAKYSWTAQANRLFDLYQELVSTEPMPIGIN